MISYDDFLNSIDKEAYNREAEKIMALVKAGHKFEFIKKSDRPLKSIRTDTKHEVDVTIPVVETQIEPIPEPELPTPIYKEEDKPVNLEPESKELLS